MSWIDDQAKKSQDRITTLYEQAEIIRKSKLWAGITHQLQRDVDAINNIHIE
jgi:hypothetical protein